MTKIAMETISVEQTRWLAVALEEESNKLVACTSNTSKQKAIVSLKAVLQRLKRLRELDEAIQFSQLTEASRRIAQLMQGKGQSFAPKEISQQNWSTARIEVSNQLMQVPRGKVISYGGLAELSNSSPRGVGSIMRSNPVPWAVPCHRVIHSDGRLGKLGGTIQGTVEKGRILRAEGVPINTEGRVIETAMLR